MTEGGEMRGGVEWVREESVREGERWVKEERPRGR